MKRINSITIDNQEYLKILRFSPVAFSFFSTLMKMSPMSADVNNNVVMNTSEELFKILKDEIDMFHFISIEISSESGSIIATLLNPEEVSRSYNFKLSLEGDKYPTLELKGWDMFIEFLKEEYEYLD